MDPTADYLIMILSPLIAYKLKLSFSYRICCGTPHFRADRYYKKHRTPWITRFFYWDIRARVPSRLIAWNLVIGCVCIALSGLSLAYLILWIAGHTLSIPAIPYAVACLEIALAGVDLILHIHDKIHGE